jgi:hypothetical protein
MKFYRFKSNPYTVLVETIHPRKRGRFLKPIWGKRFEAGDYKGSGVLHYFDEDNLIEVPQAEVLEVLEKRKAAQLLPFWLFKDEEHCNYN